MGRGPPPPMRPGGPPPMGGRGGHLGPSGPLGPPGHPPFGRRGGPPFNQPRGPPPICNPPNDDYKPYMNGNSPMNGDMGGGNTQVDKVRESFLNIFFYFDETENWKIKIIY